MPCRTERLPLVGGQALSKQRLSEGEKQIFAISVLWGLARASARSLPAIIDTPMARLDARHREHLVERYFPNASHQVIILSTDTEVDRRYYESLEPHLARAYHLNYSEAERATVAEEGYFRTGGRAFRTETKGNEEPGFKPHSFASFPSVHNPCSLESS
ncbi:MAG TPA: hypothetical protein VFI31_02495 [Pirellulales bacterium]|nr:hypothetical protein [Pirellulales bacterium]